MEARDFRILLRAPKSHEGCRSTFASLALHSRDAGPPLAF